MNKLYVNCFENPQYFSFYDSYGDDDLTCVTFPYQWHVSNTHNTFISHRKKFLEHYEVKGRHSKIVVTQNILHNLELHFDKIDTFSLLVL